MLVTKEELVTDLKNLLYRYTDALGKFNNLLKVDKQLVEAMQQIKNMVEEKDLWEKKYNELKAVAQAVVDMVDLPEEGAEQAKILLE